MTTSEYDFWLLDLDGTLIDVETSYIYEVFDEVGTRLGVSFTGHESEILWYGVGDARKRLLSKADIDDTLFWDTFHAVEDPEARANATHLYPDAKKFVPTRKEPVGLVTHCQEFLTGPILESLDIADWFDTIVCCSDETGWKPDPAPVELAMADLGVAHNGHEGVLVGDDPQDIGAAWNAGLTGAHIERYDPERFGQCVRGDVRVSSLTELDV